MNDIGKSAFKWWCEKKDFPFRDRNRMMFSEQKTLTKLMMQDIQDSLIASMNEYSTVFKRQESVIDAIRLSHAIAWINTVDVNKWIQAEIQE